MPGGASTHYLMKSSYSSAQRNAVTPVLQKMSMSPGWLNGQVTCSSGAGPLLSISPMEQGPGHRLQLKPALPTHSCVVMQCSHCRDGEQCLCGLSRHTLPGLKYSPSAPSQKTSTDPQLAAAGKGFGARPPRAPRTSVSAWPYERDWRRVT